MRRKVVMAHPTRKGELLERYVELGPARPAPRRLVAGAGGQAQVDTLGITGVTARRRTYG